MQLRSRRRRPASLADLLEQLPAELAEQAFTHASWVEHRAESYERLAFLGDAVLSLSVSTHLYPRFERYGAGRLTKLRAQAVSRQACAEVVVYRIETEEGPPHDRSFVAVAEVDGEEIGRGSGRTKKGAEQEAASQA